MVTARGEENHSPPLDYSHTDSWVLVQGCPNGNQTRSLIAFVCVVQLVSRYLAALDGWLFSEPGQPSLGHMINCC